MALSAKEREKIIEEETLRFETRQSLHAKACASHPRRGRWLWWLAGGLAAYALICHLACGGGSCEHGRGYGMHAGKRCPYHGQMQSPMMEEGAGQAPAQPGKSKE